MNFLCDMLYFFRIKHTSSFKSLAVDLIVFWNVSNWDWAFWRNSASLPTPATVKNERWIDSAVSFNILNASSHGLEVVVGGGGACWRPTRQYASYINFNKNLIYLVEFWTLKLQSKGKNVKLILFHRKNYRAYKPVQCTLQKWWIKFSTFSFRIAINCCQRTNWD